MSFFWIAMIGNVLFILVTEASLWWIFRMRMVGLHFPGVTGPLSRISGLNRVRLFAGAHTVFLLSCSILSLILLW